MVLIFIKSLSPSFILQPPSLCYSSSSPVSAIMGYIPKSPAGVVVPLPIHFYNVGVLSWGYPYSLSLSTTTFVLSTLPLEQALLSPAEEVVASSATLILLLFRNSLVLPSPQPFFFSPTLSPIPIEGYCSFVPLLDKAQLVLGLH